MSDRIVQNENSPALIGAEAAGAIASGVAAVTAESVAVAVTTATGIAVSAPAVAVAAGVAAAGLVVKAGYDMLHYNDAAAEVVTNQIQANVAKQAASEQQR